MTTPMRRSLFASNSEMMKSGLSPLEWYGSKFIGSPSDENYTSSIRMFVIISYAVIILLLVTWFLDFAFKDKSGWYIDMYHYSVAVGRYVLVLWYILTSACVLSYIATATAK